MQDQLAARFRPPCACMAAWRAGGWRLPHLGLGGLGDAAAHGDFLSAVYAAGGSGISAPGGFQPGSVPSKNAAPAASRLSPCAWASAATRQGVVGCRIIDSPRERLIAMITNNFVPCNGRFPTLIAILTHVLCGRAPAVFRASRALGAAAHGGIVLLGVRMTFLVSRLLSETVLKGVPSSFTLELPPYRRPQIGKVIVRSIFDRTLFVLGRAAAVAAPGGAAYLAVGQCARWTGHTLLTHCTGFLDPFGPLFRHGRRHPAGLYSWACPPMRSSCPSSSWRIFQRAVWWR